MVRFQFRWINKTYKRKLLYRYKYFYLGFPTSLNEEIELQMKKDFEIDYTKTETPEKEIISITLTRDKLQKSKSPPQQKNRGFLLKKYHGKNVSS